MLVSLYFVGNIKYESCYLNKIMINYRIHIYQGFDFEKSVTDYDLILKRLINCYELQEKKLINLNLLNYTRTGFLYYLILFLLNFKFKHAIKLVKITKCLNLVTFLLLPKYIFIYIKCLKINL